MLEEKNDNLQNADGNNGETAHTTPENAADQTLSTDETATDDRDELVGAPIGISSEGQPVDPERIPVADESGSPDDVPLISATEGQPVGIDTFFEETESSSDDIVVGSESNETKPIDAIIAEEGKENEEVPEDLITDREIIDENPNDERGRVKQEVISAHEDIDDVAEMVHHIEIIDHEEYERQQAAEDEIFDAVAAIENSNARDSENDHDPIIIPLQDYDDMDMEVLVDHLDEIVNSDKALSMKRHVEEIRKVFITQYHKFMDEKREVFHRENPDSTNDFHYDFPLKKRFNALLSKFREKKNAHFKNMQASLESNLKTRLEIVEEIKNLINPQENIKDTLKHFNELRERWKNAGPIPKDKYNHVWNNYHFHVENFYDYLHLDREARDMDFKHNLEQKQKLIARAEELLESTDINKAFRELQALHKIWKEDIGPVSKEYREEIWNRFSEITRQMHEKREQLQAKLRESEQANLDKKREIIAKIEEFGKENINTHSGWVAQIEKVEALRNEFFGVGRVPNEVNEETWTAFKNAVRAFNAAKNSFYKEIKRDQSENLSRKQALVAKARELENSEDFAATTPIMKQIQDEWKTIGHVPRKYSDKLWKEFKEACNHYFERLKQHRNAGSPEEAEAYDKKKAYLDTIRAFQLTGEHKSDLAAIKQHIETWKSFGRVPEAKRHIEGKFNKILDALFEKLSLSKKESEMMRFSNKLEQLAGSDDSRRIESEKIFLQRKIDEVQSEIFQLENNIQFFANAKKDNPMIVEVRKNIDRHKEQLEMLKEKLKQVRQIKAE